MKVLKLTETNEFTRTGQIWNLPLPNTWPKG